MAERRIRGRRVLVSGMGGELGSLVAALLEETSWAGPIHGIDVDPPRRRLRRATFDRIDFDEYDRIVDTVIGFDPHIVLHLGVYEPNARFGTAEAVRWTRRSNLAVLGAAAECSSVEHIVVRSGIEVYGRRRGSLTRPGESTALDPTTPFGQVLAEAEEEARTAATARRATMAAVRLAPVMGGHVPSPLGRLLRLPVVPFSLLANPAFCVVGTRDAATALVAAAERGLDQPVNVAGAGAITAGAAIRLGRRVPAPLVAPQWLIARPAAHVQGAPIPDHVHEVLTRGRLADTANTRGLLGVTPAWSTRRVIEALYDWETVIRSRPLHLVDTPVAS